jgi:hypothetical protein
MLILIQLITNDSIDNKHLKALLEMLHDDCVNGEQDGNMAVDYLENVLGFDIQSETLRTSLATVIEKGTFHSAFTSSIYYCEKLRHVLA